MNCERTGERLIDLVYGELEGPDREAVLEHLKTCRRCADEYAELRRGRAALGRVAANEPPVKPMRSAEFGVRSERHDNTRADKPPVAPGPRARAQFRFRRLVAVTASAAAAVLMIVLGMLMYPRTEQTAGAGGMPIEIKRTGVSLTILSRPPSWDQVGDMQVNGPDNQQGIMLANQSVALGSSGWTQWPGLALVRDQRIIRHIRPGKAEVRLDGVPAGIWPDTVRLRCLDGGQDLAVMEQNYQFDLASAQAVLAKHVDQAVGVLFKDGKVVKGTLLSHDAHSLVIRPSGEGPRSIARQQVASVMFEKLPQGLLTTPTLVWKLENSGQATERSFEVDYLTTGLSWRADYVLKLRPADIPGAGERAVLPSERSESRNLAVATAAAPESAIIDRADLVGYATVTNASGVTYEDAQLKLMAGDANLLMRPAILWLWDGATQLSGLRDGHERGGPQMVEKSFFEYHLYTLTRPTTIANQETKQLEMVSGRGLAMRRAYVYDIRDSETAARVVSEMENTEENGLGKPLPKGVVRLYAPDPEGVSTYVGQTTIDHTPVKEKLRLPWGYAFDIACSRRETDARHSGPDYRFTAEYALRNHKPHDVTVTVIIHVVPSTYAAECDLPWHVREVGLIEVPVTVPAGKEATFTFTHKYNDVSGGGLKSPYDTK